jgi:hypothetical protein
MAVRMRNHLCTQGQSMIGWLKSWLGDSRGTGGPHPRPPADAVRPSQVIYSFPAKECNRCSGKLCKTCQLCNDCNRIEWPE